MNSPAHQTCIFIVDFGVENGNFSEIGLFWISVACCRNMMLMLKKIVNIMDVPVNEVDNGVFECPMASEGDPMHL